MKNKNVSTIKPFCNFSYSPNLKQAPGPGKPIIAYPGFNIANRGINFIPRLDFVPESTIKTNLGTNYVLNLTHLARTINSLIGGKGLSKQTKLQTYCFTNTRKLQQREIDLDQLGTSHNLSWRGGGGGGGGGEIGGPSILFGWNMGGLKMPKDDLGGSSRFI